MTTNTPKIEESWYAALQDEFTSPYFLELKELLQKEKDMYTIFPPGSQIFTAFNLTPLTAVKVVVLGQDPYHGKGQAHGLSFSVPDGIKPPPSLQNIFKEIRNDLNIPIPQSGNLEKWAKQGVLLINATLTVRESDAGSHQGIGWGRFTDRVIQTISDLRAGVVFLLWGKFAQAKLHLIDQSKHFVLMAPHPSPFSVHRGFFGCKHFSKANQLLKENGLGEIDWRLE
ncbi:MAG: uracil-DNA glycosylase [Bacteroidetes bacterium]|nr:MAG: uracil-DNA glycosylase [Bacteroidota bacterium]